MILAKINIYRALKTYFSFFLIFIFLTAATGDLLAQKTGVKMVPSGRNAERVITVERLQYQVEFLSDSIVRGRATGSSGATEASFWICKRFQSAGLTPVNGVWSHSFNIAGKTGRNIIGFLPGKRTYENEMYTIVSAHYDSHGIIDGKLYPGADSNASGVVAMLSLADMFKKMKDLGRSYGRNVIFVATDAKEQDSAGAEALWAEINDGKLTDPESGETIYAKKIHSFVSLDILGGSLEPLTKGRKDYLIMLSDRQYISDLQDADKSKDLGLDLGFDYYGSPKFTELFYRRIGDQSVFVQNGTLSFVFTSGITKHTNKVTDTASTLNYEVFKKRIFLIFHWLEKIL